MVQNSTVFGFFLSNSGKDCERMAEVIGTLTDTEITRRMSGSAYDGTGSSRDVKKFKVHPDQIRELPPLHMFLYDKTVPGKAPELIKWPFLDLDL